ncbi:aminomethyltransferase [Loktanella sp. 3ANDIMAR09]|uniref:CAF17-like 4Fe-4S cluster assembly/insertion protein YgfZ n=1 Tax=Loktanella sp. 3ANDIMAR09 TaxID=1225657 RepID=UPI0006FAB072|nr:folate-binding protein YgfZ [Loktanella sp. 3ANDIMAR09]KQI67583.1 aminomethyltransferase [Loktanella sp. 3ANDIMAR09]
MTDRIVLALTGTDRVDFLQGLVTNDVTRADGGIVYTALLTPQGKFLADFFVLGQPDRLLIDVAASHAQGLGQRLNMYRLRADVQIATTDLIVSRGTGDAPDGALADPRHPALGWRAYATTDQSDATDWDALRVAHVIPETGIELTPETYILETGFERLNGVDFRKGCFVGQEIVARMKHKTTLRKGLVRVTLDGDAVAGTALTQGSKDAGVLHTVAGHQAIAYLRFDRSDAVFADETRVFVDLDAQP